MLKWSLHTLLQSYWDFRGALRPESLCFFRAKLRIRQPGVENASTLKRLKVGTWNLELIWGTYGSCLEWILGAISHVIRVSDPKTDMPIGGLNSSSSKNMRTKVSNSKAPGHAVSAPKIKLWRFRHFFLFLYLSILALFYRRKNFETTYARNLKFGNMRSLHMKLSTCIFGGATSRCLGQMHPKLVIAKFIKWF